MWQEYISGLTDAGVFKEPVPVWCLNEAEKDLTVAFPEELRELLRESDGVEGEYGLALAWPLERMRHDNRHFRSNPEFRRLYMPFDCLLFFADAGNGDQFAFAILDGEVRRTDVYTWNHKDDSRTWVASSLKQYLEWTLTGKFKS
jgi:hypothetical protein